MINNITAADEIVYDAATVATVMQAVIMTVKLLATAPSPSHLILVRSIKVFGVKSQAAISHAVSHHCQNLSGSHNAPAPPTHTICERQEENASYSCEHVSMSMVSRQMVWPAGLRTRQTDRQTGRQTDRALPTPWVNHCRGLPCPNMYLVNVCLGLHILRPPAKLLVEV